MKNLHPIVITECPKCGAMKAARSPYLEPFKDEAGNPDPGRALLVKIECLGCCEIAPRLQPFAVGNWEFPVHFPPSLHPIPTRMDL